MNKSVFVRGKKVEYIEAEVEVLDFLNSLLRSKGWEEDSNSYVTIKDNKLVRGVDISYHGSPHYEESIISEDPAEVNLFMHLKGVINYYRKAE